MVILRSPGDEARPEQSEGTHEILHFVQDDTLCQILRYAQNDREKHFSSGVLISDIDFFNDNPPILTLP